MDGGRDGIAAAGGPWAGAGILARLRGRRDRHPLFARLMVNLAHLAGGNASAAAVNALVLVIMARMLGPAMLGVFAMIESYATMVDQIVRLETWQPLIRYGAVALEEDRPDRLKTLVKLGMIVDLAGAGIATAVAYLAIPLAARLLHWSGDTQVMAGWYSLTVLAGLSSTPIGILRIFDRFKQVAWLETLMALVRLAAVTIAWLAHGSIWDLIAIAVVVQLFYRAVLGFLSWRELRRRGLGGFLHARLGTLHDIRRGYARLTLATNAAALVRKSTQELDVLIVGSIAGPAVVGIYDLARRMTTAAIKAGTMIQQVALPDLARLWARRDIAGFKALIGQVELVTATAGLGFVALVALRGQWLVTTLAGDRFRDATVPLIVQSVAGCLFLCGSAVRPALITAGQETRLLAIVLLSAAAFYATLFAAVPSLGAVGASVAHIAFNAVLLPLGGAAFATALRRQQAGSPAALPRSRQARPARG